MERVLADTVRACDVGDQVGCPLITTLSATSQIGTIDRHFCKIGEPVTVPLIVAEILVTIGLLLHLSELHDHAYKRLELCGEADALDQPVVGGCDD
jgi:hypothetical protein